MDAVGADDKVTSLDVAICKLHRHAAVMARFFFFLEIDVVLGDLDAFGVVSDLNALP